MAEVFFLLKNLRPKKKGLRCEALYLVLVTKFPIS